MFYLRMEDTKGKRIVWWPAKKVIGWRGSRGRITTNLDRLGRWECARFERGQVNNCLTCCRRIASFYIYIFLQYSNHRTYSNWQNHYTLYMRACACCTSRRQVSRYRKVIVVGIQSIPKRDVYLYYIMASNRCLQFVIRITKQETTTSQKSNIIKYKQI